VAQFGMFAVGNAGYAVRDEQAPVICKTREYGLVKANRINAGFCTDIFNHASSFIFEERALQTAVAI